MHYLDASSVRKANFRYFRVNNLVMHVRNALNNITEQTVLQRRLVLDNVFDVIIRAAILKMMRF